MYTKHIVHHLKRGATNHTLIHVQEVWVAVGQLPQLVHQDDTTQTAPDRLSKIFLQGLRSKPTEADHENSLDLEQSTLGLGMAMLAGLNYDEAGIDIEQIISTKPNTSASTTGSSTIAVLSNPRPISWQEVEEASAADPLMIALKNLLIGGLPDEKNVWPPELQQYHRHRDHLSTAGPVVLYKGRAVIPSSLHREILEVLHSAHQGTAGMTARAASSVYWPGMSAGTS